MKKVTLIRWNPDQKVIYVYSQRSLPRFVMQQHLVVLRFPLVIAEVCLQWEDARTVRLDWHIERYVRC